MSTQESLLLGQFGVYDFGLTSAQEERAARLHEAATIIDLLYWGPTGPATYARDVEAAVRSVWARDRDTLGILPAAALLDASREMEHARSAYFDNWFASGVTVGTRSVEVGTPEIALKWFAHVQAICDRIPWAHKALCANDIRQAKLTGQHAILVNTQLLTGPGHDLVGILEVYYQLGLRMIMLTYNAQTSIGSGCTEVTDAGLSRYGRGLVAEMNRLGMIVDTGHCGRQTTLDACDASTRPVISSHASAAGVFPHVRAKSDEEIEQIAETGGVCGVALVPEFLSVADPASIENYLDHIDYIADLVGWQHVALGTDWPAPFPASVNAEVVEAMCGGQFPPGTFRFDRQTVGFMDYSDYPNITRGLVKRGYGDEQILGILGGNALRVIEQVCG